MPERLKHPEWRESHYGTKYPFADNVTLTNDDGIFIPEDIFLDAVFYPIGGGANLYLSKIVLTYETVTIYLGDENNDELASCSFAILQAPSQAVFYDEFERPAGVIISEPIRLVTFQSWGVGTYLFTAEQSGFAATCCIPTPQIGVRGFVLDDGSIMTGDVYLFGDDGIILSVTDMTDDTAPLCIRDQEEIKTIRVDVVGDPLFVRKSCEAAFLEKQFLEQVTVEAGACRVICGPDTYGDFKLTGGSTDTAHPTLRIKKLPEKNAILIEAAGTKVGKV